MSPSSAFPQIPISQLRARFCAGRVGALRSQTSKEIQRERNEAFGKFLAESSKRQMFFDSCDYSQYDPFEKRCECGSM
jgi:hypothetical protein